MLRCPSSWWELSGVPPEYVRPYVNAQKNDDRDAATILAATGRPTMRFVKLKSEGQLFQSIS